MTSKLPRFADYSHARGSADRYVRPLPSSISKRLAETEEGEAHANVAERYGQAKTRVIGLREKLKAAKRSDAEKEREVLLGGAKAPRLQAPGVEDELETAEHQLGMLEGLLAEYAQGLLGAAIPLLGEAQEEVEGRLEHQLAAVREAVQNVLADLEACDQLASERAWLAQLAGTGTVFPFTAGGTRVSPRLRDALQAALAAFEEDAVRRHEVAEEIERERQEAERLPLPPGREVWTPDGRTMVVGPAGKLQEAEEVER